MSLSSAGKQAVSSLIAEFDKLSAAEQTEARKAISWIDANHWLVTAFLCAVCLSIGIAV